jgi:membrane protease YdiL (CAAX protease family)
MPPVAKNPLSYGEVALIVAIFAGWFIVASVRAVVAGFPVPHLSDQEALSIVLIECVASPVALAVLYFRGWRLKDGAVRITWFYSFVGLLLFGIAYFAEDFLYEVLSPDIGGGDFLVAFRQSITLSPVVALVTSVVNGVFEEFFLCRYLVEAFSRFGLPMALGVSALVRVAYHLYQGPLGALLVLGFGILVTVFYWRYRQVWPVMFAHILTDLLALG